MAGLEIIEKDNQEYIESESWNKGLDIYIEIPRKADLDLKTYNDGAVKVNDVEGDVVIESFNGPIRAENISGSLLANTYNGPITVTFDRVKPDTPLAFSTYNGNVDVSFP